MSEQIQSTKRNRKEYWTTNPNKDNQVHEFKTSFQYKDSTLAVTINKRKSESRKASVTKQPIPSGYSQSSYRNSISIQQSGAQGKNKNSQQKYKVSGASRELSNQDRNVFSAEVINSGINGDFEKIMQFNSPIDEADGEPQVVDLTDDFEEQEQYVLSKQRSNENENEGATQYFDNRDQFLSTEDQQRKLTSISHTQVVGNKSSNILKVRKNMFMSNITEVSPLTGSKSTTNKKVSQQKDKEVSKSSHVTSFNRKDSATNLSKKPIMKYDGTIVASEKKLGSSKKLKIGLSSQTMKASDQSNNQYSASVNVPVRSFLTNSANKIPSLKNHMKTVIDNKQDNPEGEQKLTQAKSAKFAVSSTYLKKFKSHQNSNKMLPNANGPLSQGSSQGQVNQSGGQISFINQLNQRNAKQKNSPVIGQKKSQEWQSLDQRKYNSHQKPQPAVKQERAIFASSISPKIMTEQKAEQRRENLYQQRQNQDKAKFSSTQIYISKVKSLAPQSMYYASSLPRQAAQNQNNIQKTQLNRFAQNRNSTLVGPLRNATISLVQTNSNYASSSNQSLDKFISKKSLGTIGTLANKYKNLHKLSVNSNNSINSRFNMAQAVNGSNKRPQNNPFTDIQSFSSNGMGQIMGISFKKIGGNNSSQAMKCIGDTNQPSKPQDEQVKDEYAPIVTVDDEEDQVIQDELLDQDKQEQKSIQNDSFEKGSLCSNISEHQNQQTSNNKGKDYHFQSNDNLNLNHQSKSMNPNPKSDLDQQNQAVRQSNVFLSLEGYKSLAGKKGSLQAQFAPLKTLDIHQMKNALGGQKKSVSKPYISQQTSLKANSNQQATQQSPGMSGSKTNRSNNILSKRNSLVQQNEKGFKQSPSNKPIIFNQEQKIAKVMKSHKSESSPKNAFHQHDFKSGNKNQQKNIVYSQKAQQPCQQPVNYPLPEQSSIINTINEENIEESTLISKRPSRRSNQNIDSTTQGQINSEETSTRRKQIHLNEFETQQMSHQKQQNQQKYQNSQQQQQLQQQQQQQLQQQKLQSPKKKILKKTNDTLNKAYIQQSSQTNQNTTENTVQSFNADKNQQHQNYEGQTATLFSQIQQQQSEGQQFPQTQRVVVPLMDLQQQSSAQLTTKMQNSEPVTLAQDQKPQMQTIVQKQNNCQPLKQVVNNDVSCTNPQQPSSSIGLTTKTQQSLISSALERNGMNASNLNRESQQQEVAEQPQYPLSAEDAIKFHGDVLNDYEKMEIHKFDKHIYYAGQNCKRKIKGHCNPLGKSPEYIQKQKERLKQISIFNHGYDDEQGDYQVILKDHLGYRFEVLEFLGQGSFGQAIKCLDHKTQNMVAIKIIRNKKKFQYQAGIELKTLKYLNIYDKYDQNNIIRVNDFMVFRKHLLIAFECLSINLYEFIKNNNFQGVNQSLIRRFAIQILQALKFQRDHGIVHCDLKPENILLKQENKSGIKIIDYGSSCFLGQRIYTYIQSRFYRAPEIILGVPYTMAIDMWSFGCIIAELYTGYPIFPGENEVDQLAYIMEVCGIPEQPVLDLSTRRHLFYDDKNKPILMPNSKGKIRSPNAKTLAQVLRCKPKSRSSNLDSDNDNRKFLDFLERCFVWHPEKRMTPLEALHHEWVLEGLPEKVLEHHLKMFSYQDNSFVQQTYLEDGRLKKNIREDNNLINKATNCEIQGFPPNAQTKSIYEIVGEIRRDEQEREKRRQIKERKYKEELMEKERQRKRVEQQQKNVINDTQVSGSQKQASKHEEQPQDKPQFKSKRQSGSFNKQQKHFSKYNKKFSQTQPPTNTTGILNIQQFEQDMQPLEESPAKVNPNRLSTKKKSQQFNIQKINKSIDLKQQPLSGSNINSPKGFSNLDGAYNSQVQKAPSSILIEQANTSVINANGSSVVKSMLTNTHHPTQTIIDEQNGLVINHIINQEPPKPKQDEEEKQQHPEAQNELDDDEDEDTIEDDMVEISRNHALKQTTQGSQNHSLRGDIISQRMELQSRIKDQVFGTQQQDTKVDDADSFTVKQGDDLNEVEQDQVDDMQGEDLHSDKTSTSSDMMMDMSECPGVLSATGKELISDSNTNNQQKKQIKTNVQKVFHGPNNSIQTYGQQAHPRLMPSSGQMSKKQLDTYKTQMLKRTQGLINFPNQSQSIPNRQSFLRKFA